MTPVLHISGNDVTLAAVAATALPGVGIAVVSSEREHPAAVLLTANRVLTADARTVAGSIINPATAAVTGNVFMQTSGPAGVANAPAFMLLSDGGIPFEVAANVIHTTSIITPSQRASPPATASWDFLNGVG